MSLTEITPAFNAPFSTTGQARVCLLWADLVGFSQLSLHQAEDYDGRELIAAVMTDLMARCWNQAIRSGATLISLGGDSWILAWLVPETDDENFFDPCASAVSNARFSHAVCEKLSENHGIDLKLRVVCSVGSAEWLNVEISQNRQNKILIGTAMQDAADLLEKCEPGSTLANFTDYITKKNQDSEDDQAMHAACTQFTEDASRTVCTVLFCAVEYQELSRDCFYQLIPQLTLKIRNQCAGFAARLVRVRIDEKGCTYLVLLGYDHQELLNPAQAAMELAQAVASDITHLGLNFGMGLCGGRVFSCEMKLGEVAEFSALGECINWAALIANTHRNQIWVDEKTARMTQFEGLASTKKTISSKNALSSSNTLEIFRLDVAHQVRTESLEYTGEQGGHQIKRVAVIEDLKRRLKKSSRLVLVAEAGAGKTVILEQLEKELKQDFGWQVIKSSCSALRTQQFGIVGLGLWRSWLGDQHKAGVDLRILVSKVKNQCPEEHKNCLEVLLESTVAGINSVQFKQFAPLLDIASVGFFQWWAVGYLQNYQFLIVEDVHWIDDLSAKHLRAILSSAPQMQCIFSSRKSVTNLLHVGEENIYELPSIQSNEIQLFLKHKFPSVEVHVQVAEHVLQMCAKNALLIHFWLDEAVRRGWYSVFRNQLLLTLPESMLANKEFEPSVELHLLLQYQIEKCSKNTKQFLGILSTFGKPIPMSQLAVLCGDDFDVKHAVLEATENSILSISFQLGTEFIWFIHDLIREASYSRLASHVRKECHSLIANYLSNQSEKKHASMERAWHLMHTDRFTQDVFEEIFNGAHEARKINAIDMATQLFDFLRKNSDLFRHADRPNLGIIDAWHAVSSSQKGKTDASTVALEKFSIKIYGEKNLYRQAIYFFHHVWIFAFRSFQVRRRSFSTSFQSDFMSPRTQVLQLLAEKNFFLGNFSEYMWNAICAVHSSEKSKNLNDLVTTYAAMSLHAKNFGFEKISNCYSLIALKLVRAKRDKALYLEAMFFFILREIGCANWSTAKFYFKRIFSQGHTFSVGRRYDEILVVYGQMLQYIENYSDAYLMFSDLEKRSAIRGDKQIEVWALLGCARISYLENNADKLFSFLSQIEANEMPDVMSELDRDALRMVAFLKRDRLDQCMNIFLDWSLDRLKGISATSFNVSFSLRIFYLFSEIIFFLPKTQVLNNDFPIRTKKYLELLKINAFVFKASRCDYLVSKLLHHTLRKQLLRSQMAYKKAHHAAMNCGMDKSLQVIDFLGSASDSNPVALIRKMLHS